MYNQHKVDECIMRGHFISGTRKLNRHYQSGAGDGGFIYNMFYAIYGFEYGRPTEEYTSYYGAADFYDYQNGENMSVAPIHKLWTTTPTVQKTEKKNVIYSDEWHYSYNGFAITAASGRSAEETIWRYGMFQGDPYWIYDSIYILWHRPTYSDSDYNQDGINQNAVSTGLPGYYDKNNQDSFENMYNGKAIDVVVPTYELIAVQDEGFSPNGGVVISEGSFPFSVKNQTRLKGALIKPQRVQGIGGGSGSIDLPSDWPHLFKGPDNATYWLSRSMTASNQVNSQIGCICTWDYSNDGTYFPSMHMYYYLDSGDGLHPKSAGTYVDPVSGYTINMVYAMRLVNLEKKTVYPANRVLSFVTGDLVQA